MPLLTVRRNYFVIGEGMVARLCLYGYFLASYLDWYAWIPLSIATVLVGVWLV